MAQEQRIQQVEDDVDRVDPENPTSMVVPVPGDRVLMTDGSTARVAARREVGGGVMLQVQRAGLDYAEWVGVEEIEAHLDDGRVHDVAEAWDLAHAEDSARAETDCVFCLDVRQSPHELPDAQCVECNPEARDDADDGRVHDPVEAEGETRLMVGPCTCAGQADSECDCTGCIGRHIECRLTDPWSDTAEPEGEPADVGED